MGWSDRLPGIGEKVGEYQIVEKLGSGSHGHVFKAEQAGCFYAVKLLRGRLLHDRARREISILVHLQHPDVVRFYGCGYWPDPFIGHSYIVMEFAGGRTLKVYAQEENPSARRAARIALDTALTLGDVLRQGVMHRDLKPDNIIIRDVNAKPLLIDFGVGSLVGSPAVTGACPPPGTPEFRAPEAWRFIQENADDSARYDYDQADELWALGVTFYWLLTDVLPFGDRADEEGGGLAERVLHRTPVLPHVLNPCVPRALSDICMRTLEKAPSARYASALEFCLALDEAMSEAEVDPTWDRPLFQSDGPDNKPTRGRRKPPEKVPEPVVEVPPIVPEQEVPTVAVAPVEPPPPEPVIPRPPPASRPRTRSAAAAGLAVGVLGISLLARVLCSPPMSAPPGTSSETLLTPQAGTGREVAPSEKQPDPPDGGGAEPMMDSITSAPVMITMLYKDDASEKCQKETKVFGNTGKALGAAALCTALSACTAAPQIRPTLLAPAPCPEGSVETMKRLGLKDDHLATFHLTIKTVEYITIQEGDITLRLVGEWGALPQKTSLLGRLSFGEERVFGRLTEAQTSGGEKFRVCLELVDSGVGGRGVRREPPGSARIWSTVGVMVVDKFE